MTATQRSWRGLVGVLTAQAMAWTGTRLLSVALPWFVLTTTGSAARTGLVVFAQLAPMVVAQVLSGPIIDRIGPRRVSIGCDLLAAVTLSVIPLLYARDALSFAALIALMAIVGAADGPSTAAKLVFTPEVTKAAGVPLERGTGLTSTIERTASTVGPAVAGVLVGAIGGGFLIAGVPRFIVLALGAPLWLVVAVHAVGGLGSGVINPILGAIQFERIPAPLLGRVKTMTMALAWAGMPFGAMVGGAMVTVAGLVPALLVAGAGYLIATTLPGVRPEWAEMDRTRQRGEATGYPPRPSRPRRPSRQSLPSPRRRRHPQR